MSPGPRAVGAHRRHSRWRVLGLCGLSLILAVAVVLVGDSRTCPRGETIKAFALIATPQDDATAEGDVDARVRAGDLPELAVAVTRRLDDGSLPASAARTENVQAGQFLQVHARVTDHLGRPAEGVKVVYVWRQGKATSFDTAVSDSAGRAKVTHWVELSQRGHRTVLVVSAARGDYSASAYTWFVPE